MPKPILDFLEGLLAAFVIGAIEAVYSADLLTASPKLLLYSALIGGLNASISAARRALKPAP